MRGTLPGRALRALLLAAALSACGSADHDDGPQGSAQPMGSGAQGAAGHASEGGAGSGAATSAAAGGASAAGSRSSTTVADPNEVDPPAGEDGSPPNSSDPGSSRVLAFDGAARWFAVYDAAGTIVHDLWSQLGIAGPSSGVSVSWGDTTARADNTMTATRLRTRAAGLPDPASTQLVVATELSSGGTHVEVWALDGEVLAEVELAEHWEHFALSPAGAYLLVERTPVPENTFALDAALIRIADGEIVWQGPHSSSAFARDDTHFVFAPRGDDPVGLIDLATGEVSGAANPDLYKYEQGVQLDVEACSSTGAVLRTYGWITDGQPLWSLGWDGQLRAFDPALPRLADEIFYGFADDGASVLWLRNAKEAVNGLTPIDDALLGFFQLDLATGDSRTIMPPDYECTTGRTHRFELGDTALSACECVAGGCDDVAPLPTLSPGWERSTTVSADGRFALVTSGWPGNAFPKDWPDSLLFDASGALLATLPSGYGRFDRDSELLLFQAQEPMRRTGIVELQTAHVTWIDLPFASAIVYE